MKEELIHNSAEMADKDCPWRAKLWGKYYYFDEFLNVKFSWEKTLK